MTLQHFLETGGRPANVDYMAKLGERYTEEVSDIKIEPIVAPEGMTSTQKLETMVAGGTPPDIVYSGASVSKPAALTWSWYGSGRLPSRLPGQPKWLAIANEKYPDVAWSVYVDAYDYASPDWSAKQANINRLYDLVTAELLDPIAGEPDVVVKELAVAIKPKIQELLQEV